MGLKSLIRKLEDSRSRMLLELLDRDEKRQVMESTFHDFVEMDKEDIREFEGFDAEFGTGYADKARYIFQQLQLVRLHYYDIASMEAATAAGRLLNELASLDREFRKVPEIYTPELFQGTIKDMFEMAKEYFVQEQLEKVFDYPKTIDEFYQRYSAI